VDGLERVRGRGLKGGWRGLGGRVTGEGERVKRKGVEEGMEKKKKKS
jgi:hypothetical protein